MCRALCDGNATELKSVQNCCSSREVGQHFITYGVTICRRNVDITLTAVTMCEDTGNCTGLLSLGIHNTATEVLL